MTETEAASGINVDAKGIMRMIPHRYPLLFIDRVENMISDVTATGIKNVSMNEAVFQGHFPTDPVLPGVMIVEAMAQTAAVLVVHTLGAAFEGKLVYFMSIENARFRKPVLPGDQLRLIVRKDRNRGPVWKFIGEAKVGDQLVAEATFAAMIRD
ncbi:MAG TPA: 3-hydroxyacyl-ACP dehydratase FabZ [Terriglobales bacterium]|nr:3-hydroxyacyl-ACP dehydratase FabZ [Terriglobales bacterium]